MNEDLVPPDFLISPDLFESYFVSRENYNNIRPIALDGHLGTIRNRYISWRIFLGILPEIFSIGQWIERVKLLRDKYEKITKSHRVIIKVEL